MSWTVVEPGRKGALVVSGWVVPMVSATETEKGAKEKGIAQPIGLDGFVGPGLGEVVAAW